MATVVHFDVSAENITRAKKFYTDVLDWKFTSVPGPVDYLLIETTDLNGNKAVGGGMSAREGRPAGMINYFGVQSLDEVVGKVLKSGGKVITPRQEIPGWGSLAVCADTEDNIFGIFEETR